MSDSATPWTVVRGILQPRILEWGAFPFSRRSSQPRDQTQSFCIAGGFVTSWTTREGLEYWGRYWWEWGTNGMLIHHWWKHKSFSSLEEIILSYKVKHILTIWLNNLTSKYLHKKNETLWWQKDLYLSVQRCFIHISKSVGNNPNVHWLMNW